MSGSTKDQESTYHIEDSLKKPVTKEGEQDDMAPHIPTKLNHGILLVR